MDRHEDVLGGEEPDDQPDVRASQGPINWDKQPHSDALLLLGLLLALRRDD